MAEVKELNHATDLAGMAAFLGIPSRSSRLWLDLCCLKHVPPSGPYVHDILYYSRLITNLDLGSLLALAVVCLSSVRVQGLGRIIMISSVEG